MTKANNRFKPAPGKPSSRIFFILVTVVLVLFAMFWLIGFDHPYEENENFNAPLLTDTLLGLCYLICGGTAVCTVWDMIRTWKIRGKSSAYENKIPVRKIHYAIIAVVLLFLLLSFLLGSATPMQVNGTTYNDVTWLKVSDMFIYTSGGMILIAVAAVICGATHLFRNK